jgi:hypothetical protein
LGTEVRLQAVPEKCELLKRARTDPQIAELMASFNRFALGIHHPKWKPSEPEEIYFDQAVHELTQVVPGLSSRFLNTGRLYDAAIYLLSEKRRAGARLEKDDSLARVAIWGRELLYPRANGIGPYCCGFVPSQDVVAIAEYFESVSFEPFREYYDPAQMEKAGVYKIYSSDDQETLHWIWEEFISIRDFYREVARYHEAVVAVVD